MAMQTGSENQGQINMTPMIDVLLVLIIIFMVITPLAPKGYRAEVPQDSLQTRHTVNESTVVVEVNSQGVFTINRSPIAPDALEARLLNIFKLRSEKTVFVKGDRSLEYQIVVPVFVAARAAGIDRVGLLTK